MVIMTGRRARIRAVLGVCAGFILLSGMVYLANGIRPVPPQPPTRPPASRPPKGPTGGTITSKNGVIIFPDHGPRVWYARAQSITGSAASNAVELHEVECRLYQDGKEALRVQAARGTAYAQGSAVVVSLREGIQAQDTQGGLRCTADAFEWSSAHDRISATNVVWTGAGFSHRGEHAELSTDLTRAEFRGHVRTRTLD